MTKTNILIFLFLASFTVIVAQTKKPPMGNANAPSKKDTTLSKQYVYKLIVPADKLAPTLDTLQGVMSMLGKTLTVDQASQYSEIASRNIRRLISNAQLDSIVTTKK